MLAGGARGYPKTGYLNKLQLKALQSEIVSTRIASDDSDDGSHRSRQSGGGGRHYRGGGGGDPAHCSAT